MLSRRRLLWIAALIALPLSAGAAKADLFDLTPAKLDAVFKDYGLQTPGCAVGIYSKGRVLYAKGYGMADLGFGVPITPATLFDIGSTSKQFTAAAIVLLANQGRLRLTDDVHKYIPELPQYETPITIDHLLHHTSGLRDYNGLLYVGGHYYEDYTDDEDALNIIVAQRELNFAPGSKWDYSNTGYFLLSVIVKRVSGQTLADYAKEHLLTPLGMKLTHFRIDHTAILPNRASAYSPVPTGGYRIDMSDWDQTGDGGINTNVLELANWDANFYNASIGGRALIDALVEPGQLNDGSAHGYGRGEFIDRYRGLRRVQHGGAWAGYRAMLMRFPDQGLSIALTCNVGNANTEDRADALADVILARDFKEEKMAATPAAAAGVKAGVFDSSAYLGSYFSEDEQSAVSIAVHEGRPVLEMYGMTFPLESPGQNLLLARTGALSLEFTEANTTVRVTGASTGIFRRVLTATPSGAELTELAGRYRSAEIGATWTIRVDGAKTYIRGRVVGESQLVPIMRDGYSTGEAFFMFTRGADGRINGFDVSEGRMQKIRFDR